MLTCLGGGEQSSFLPQTLQRQGQGTRPHFVASDGPHIGYFMGGKTHLLHLDALKHTALVCLAMRWLIRKSAALIAAYSIVLQALLSGFVPAGPFGIDQFAVICTTDGSSDHAPSVPQHGHDCDVCLTACNASPALVPESVAFSPAFFADRPKRLLPAVGVPSLQPRHQPQASRAPPIPS
jgi:hypothetical protein